ncbi:unnamed protein product, partial [Ectocarpus sp. 8 AP-2014]
PQLVGARWVLGELNPSFLSVWTNHDRVQTAQSSRVDRYVDKPCFSRRVAQQGGEREKVAQLLPPCAHTHSYAQTRAMQALSPAGRRWLNNVLQYAAVGRMCLSFV